MAHNGAPAGDRPGRAAGVPCSPWRFVVSFGIVSLLADVVYEGARSVTGPFLASLGASAAVVGIVTGLGEAIGLIGRLGSGLWADRTRAYWPLTIAGYALTVAAVPLLGIAHVLWIAAVLVIAERAGKALRSPAKDTMLSHATGAVGRGKGFAVHEALDQIGAIAGPLLVALVLYTSGSYTPTFVMLAVPGIAVLAILLWVRRKVPDPARYEPEPPSTSHPGTALAGRPKLPAAFWRYMVFTVVTTLGYATFGVLSFHLVHRHIVAAPIVPVIYAAAMGIDAVAALAAGQLYDRIGRRSLVVVPIVSAAIPLLAFSRTAAPAIVGILLWGIVMGIQESTMRAAVADLVPTPRRGTGYGIFAAGFGVAAFIGGVLTGVLYDISIPLLVIVVGAIQAVALILFVVISRADRAAS